MKILGSNSDADNANYARFAKVYIDEYLCGTLPHLVEESKLYSINCDLVGNFIKIYSGIRGPSDGNILNFSNVYVYTGYEDHANPNAVEWSKEFND